MTVEGTASVDLTTLFRSCVKTIRTRNKAIGVTLPQTKIFPSAPTPSSQFYARARDIMANIISHKNLLGDHRKKYLQVQDQAMSDYERSYMEKVVNTNLRIIEDNLRTLRAEVKGEQQGSKDALQCRHNIMAVLDIDFQDINSSFKHMKETRKKRQKEKENLFRLQRPPGYKKRPPTTPPDPLTSPRLTRQRRDTSEDEHEPDSETRSSELNQKESDGSPDSTTGHTAERRETEEGGGTAEATLKPASTSSYIEEEVEHMLEELSAEERQVLEEENAHLYKELMSNREEVRQITRQVVELGEMQDLLSENVDLQAHQIDEIHETLMGATESVRDGNEQVREAMRKDAGFRVWIMFFLIVMSVTILFLDWYNS